MPSYSFLLSSSERGGKPAADVPPHETVAFHNALCSSSLYRRAGIPSCCGYAPERRPVSRRFPAYSVLPRSIRARVNNLAALIPLTPGFPAPGNASSSRTTLRASFTLLLWNEKLRAEWLHGPRYANASYASERTPRLLLSSRRFPTSCPPSFRAADPKPGAGNTPAAAPTMVVSCPARFAISFPS